MMYHQTSITNYQYNTIRRRAKRRIYIRNGISKLFTKPTVVILMLLLIIAGIIVTWKATVVVAVHLITITALVPVFIYALRISISLVTVLLFTAFLYLFGMPRKASKIEADIADTFKIKKSSTSFYRCPFLVSCKPVEGTTEKEYVFWSKWIDVKQWNERKGAVLWALYVRSDKDFEAGKGRHTVTIRAVPGVVPEERETPQDPMFM